MQKRVSAFDLDRTLINGHSSVHAIEALAARGALIRHAQRLAEIEALRETAGDLQYIRAINAATHDLTHDLDPATIAPAAEDTAERWQAGIFAEMLPELADALDDGPVLIVSNGPHAFVEAFARRIGAAGGIGTPLDHYQTRTYPDKGRQLQVAAKLAGLIFGEGGNARLVRAYGDSEPDLPKLIAADEAILVNPTDALLTHVQNDPTWQGRAWRRIDCAAILEFGDLTGRLTPPSQTED
jgi:phosphoserine phosphatase